MLSFIGNISKTSISEGNLFKRRLELFNQKEIVYIKDNVGFLFLVVINIISEIFGRNMISLMQEG